MLEPLEAAALDVLLAGDDPVRAALRQQRSVATIASREYTGVEFFVDFDVPDSAPLAPTRDCVLGNCEARIAGLQHGAGLMLFIKAGQMSMLEACTYDEPWPDDVSDFSITSPAR